MKITRGNKTFKIPQIIQYSCIISMKISTGKLKSVLNKMVRYILVTTRGSDRF